MKARLWAGALLLVLAGASPAWAAITFVQSTGGFGTASGTSITSTAFATNPVVAHRIIVLAWSYNGTAVPTLTASDNMGNTYTADAQAVYSTYQNAAVLSAPVTVSGAGFTVTVTSAAAGSQIQAVAMEYSGLGPRDQTGTQTGTAASPTVSTAGATSAATELVESVLGIYSPGSLMTSISPAAGYTDRYTQLDNNANTAGEGSDRISTSAGVQSNTWTTNPASTGWAAAVATYVAACAAVPDASYVATDAQSGQAIVYWSSANPVLILRKTAAFSGEAPANYTAYTVGSTIGAATVVGTGVVASPFTQTGLVNGTTYYYKVFAMTGTGASSCYAPGTVNTGGGVSALPATGPQAWSYTLAGGSTLRGGSAWSGAVYTSSNASELISLNTTNGTQSWAPVATTAAIQGWLTPIPLSGGGTAALGGDQSGKVYSVNAATGATNWGVTLTGANAVQAAVSAQLRAYSNAAFQSTYTTDVIFAASRNTSSTNNQLVALNASTGAVLWTFNGTGTYNVDDIVGQPWVDYARNYVYVASMAGSSGTQSSLWVINSLTGNLVASLALGHLRTSPTLSTDGKTLYVADISGNLYALDTTTLPASLGKKWTSPAALGASGMTFVRAAQNLSTSGGSSVSVTMTNNAAGDFLAVACRQGNDQTSISSASDTAGNTYTMVNHSGSDTSGNREDALFYAANIKSAASNTISCNFSPSEPVGTTVALVVLEFSGLAAASPTDGNVTSSNNSLVTSLSSGNLTTANANDLLLYETNVSVNESSFTAGSGYVIPTNGSNARQAVQYKIVSATGTYSTTASWSTSSAYGDGVFAAFKAAGAAIADTSFVWEDATTAGRLYFSTTDGNVWCLQDPGPGAPPSLTTPCSGWSAVKTAVGTPSNAPSTPLLLNYLFVSGWNSTSGWQIYQLNPSTGTIVKQVTVGDGTKQPGDVSTETGNEIFVGTSEGKIFQFPLTGGSL